MNISLKNGCFIKTLKCSAKLVSATHLIDEETGTQRNQKTFLRVTVFLFRGKMCV